jgi:hypothetical protein
VASSNSLVSRRRRHSSLLQTIAVVFDVKAGGTPVDIDEREGSLISVNVIQLILSMVFGAMLPHRQPSGCATVG